MRIENRPKLQENPAEKYELQRLSDDQLSNTLGAAAKGVEAVAALTILYAIVVRGSTISAPASFDGRGQNAV